MSHTHTHKKNTHVHDGKGHIYTGVLCSVVSLFDKILYFLHTDKIIIIIIIKKKKNLII